jgi:D-alanine-D-alanine ligase
MLRASCSYLLSMRIAFLYNEATEEPALVAEEEQPTLSPVVAALGRLGHTVSCVACTLDLSAVRRQLERIRPDVAFNRVESLGGSDAMMAAIPLLLETLHIPCTGCSSEALAATASKLAVKQRLVRASLPTPPWVASDGRVHAGDRDSKMRWGTATRTRKFILKSVYEHASFGLSDESILDSTELAAVKRAIRRCNADYGRPFFAEQFVEGREFNLSVVGDRPEVLPPAEIDFSALPAGKPHIVNRDAKCDASTYEYRHTPRRFDFPTGDRALLNRLRQLAADCARLFNVQGYARVDFRCDEHGHPWILEVNSNPCVSPNAGFMAAMEQAGYSYDNAVQRLLDDALSRGIAGTPRSVNRRNQRVPKRVLRT